MLLCPAQAVWSSDLPGTGAVKCQGRIFVPVRPRIPLNIQWILALIMVWKNGSMHHADAVWTRTLIANAANRSFFL